VLSAVLLAALATALQARRDEARAADLALVVAPAVPPDELLERSVDLYQRGFAPQLVLAGEGADTLRAALLERGVAEDAVVVAVQADGEAAQLRAAAQAARATGAGSVLVVGAGSGQLRWLKLAGDAGLRAHGVPVPPGGPGPLELLAASGRYWRYVLFGL
jgi:uncharacterized SAM-binding protein YcdF (DUF218 family)